ncbi:MAG: Hsp70 family protein, partial [Actinomycetia bacterium]|nr:Hsp70 family protein [Actinomycetes bacterium]
PRGIPQIEVTFDSDANGIVHVSAKDRATDKEQSITITGQSTLSKDDIDQMVKDAEAHAEEDRQRLEEAEIRNNADSLVYQTEKLLKDVENIPDEEKEAVEGALAELKTAIAGTDTEAIKDGTEKLMMASQTVSTKLYEQAAADDAAAGGGADGGDAPDDDDVVAAEIVDDDDQDGA